MGAHICVAGISYMSGPCREYSHVRNPVEDEQQLATTRDRKLLRKIMRQAGKKATRVTAYLEIQSEYQAERSCDSLVDPLRMSSQR